MKSKKPRKPTIDDVIAYFGDVKTLANKLKITQHAIYMWRGRIPKSRAFEIQILSDGKFKADELPTSMPE